MACKALDGQVAVPADDELGTLLKQFECVRIVQMHGVDLQRFAFDGSLTWAIFLLHPDGTIYGRYGSRSGLKDLSEREISLAGFKKTLRGALDLHRRYAKSPETVGPELAGKSSRTAPRWTTPESIPTLKSNPRFQQPFVGAPGTQSGCIHCHMVPTHRIRSLRDAGETVPLPELFPYPMPNQIGFRLDPQEMATVLRVREGTAASRAGLKPGDRIVRVAGQPIISTADVQWILHHADASARIPIELSRGDASPTVELVLEEGWREQLVDWRFINKGVLRQVVGFNVDMVPRRRARRIGLGGKLALTVDRTTRELRMATGIGNRDLIVAVDGKREPMTVGAFLGYVLGKKSGDKIKITIMQLTDRLPRPEHTVEVVVK